VEITGETDKTVWLDNDRQERKITDYQVYHDTWEAAQAYLVDRLGKTVDIYRRQLISATDELRRLKALQPDPWELQRAEIDNWLAQDCPEAWVGSFADNRIKSIAEIYVRACLAEIDRLNGPDPRLCWIARGNRGIKFACDSPERLEGEPPAEDELPW
jgi:hypothetical protein